MALEFFLILALAALATFATFQIRLLLKPKPPVPSISKENARALRGNVLWVDVRNIEDFERKHIEGALHFDESAWDESMQSLLSKWTPDSHVVTYGVGPASERAERVALKLKRELGQKTVFLLEGGWASWGAN